MTRKNFVNRKQPYDNSGLPHLDNAKGVFSYTDHDIVDIIETLDTWVAAWPGQNSGKPFAALAPGEPQGRIIDMVYYHKHANDKAWQSADKEVIMALAKDDHQEQTWTIEVDFEVMKAIWAERQKDDISFNPPLRRLLRLADRRDAIGIEAVVVRRAA